MIYLSSLFPNPNMKFLFEWISCYRTQDSSSSDDPEPPSSKEETQSLFMPPNPTMPLVVGRMKRRSRSRSFVGSDWRPTLFVISEDNVVPPAEKKVAVPQLEQKKKLIGSKRCTIPAAWSWIRLRAYDNFGHDAYPISVPAFAPTPFMF